MLRLLKIFAFLIVFFLWTEYAIAQETKISTQNGWVKISINIPEFHVVVDDKLLDAIYMQNGDSLKLDVGHHSLRIISRVSSDYKTGVWIQKNKTTTKRVQVTITKRPRSSYQLIENEINYRITTDSESTIFIDDEEIGTGYSEVFLNPGVYKLKTVHPEYGSLTKRIKADYYDVRSIRRFNENPNTFNPIMRLIPGYSYIKNKEYGKAVVTYSGIAVLTSAVIFLNRDFKRESDFYDLYYDQYLNASSYEEATVMTYRSKRALSEMSRIDKQITVGLIGIALIYLGSTIDGFIKPKSGYKWSNENRIKAGMDLETQHGSPTLQLSLKAYF